MATHNYVSFIQIINQHGGKAVKTNNNHQTGTDRVFEVFDTYLKRKPKIESVFVGYETHKNFWEKNKNKKWTRLRKWMSLYQSRQVRRSIVREDTGLSCASRAYLWRKGKRIGNRVEIIMHKNEFSFVDIHTKNDFKLLSSF